MQAPALVLLIGLAVGVDYSMFYLKREREERAAGRSEQAALEAAAATSGRSVLDLRPDRDRGDGRHVPDRRLDLRLARRRDDHRRRDRDARLADGAAGAALEARRQRRPGTRAVRRPPSPGRRREAGSGARSSTASCAGRCSRSSSPAGCCWRSLRRRSSCAWRWPGPDTFPQSLPVVQAYKRMQQAFPGHRAAGQRRRQGRRTSTHPRCRTRSASSSSGRSRAAGCTSRSRSPSTATRRSRTSPSRSTARRPTAEVGRGARRAPRRDRPRDGRARCRTPRPASPGWRPSGRTRPTS